MEVQSIDIYVYIFFINNCSPKHNWKEHIWDVAQNEVNVYLTPLSWLYVVIDFKKMIFKTLILGSLIKLLEQ